MIEFLKQIFNHKSKFSVFFLLRWEELTLVANAGGRSISEIGAIWKGLNEDPADLEIFSDLQGTHFVSVRSTESLAWNFVLEKDSNAFDRFLTWKKGQIFCHQ